MNPSPNIVAVVPAYNEARCIADTVSKLLQHTFVDGSRLQQVVVCDNASTDGTDEQARLAGAAVVHEPVRGYGAACLAAIEFIRHSGSAPDVIVFYNADQSEPVADINHVLMPVLHGVDLCVGERSSASDEQAVLLQQRLGNYLVSGLIRLLWQVNCRDLGPLRAIRWQALQALNMRDKNYGWTVEMQCKAYSLGLKVESAVVRAQTNATPSRISGSWRGIWGAASKMLGWVIYLAIKHYLSVLTRPIQLLTIKNRS